jgi:cell fate regulator YaaT (PSP1 superfamily)
LKEVVLARPREYGRIGFFDPQNRQYRAGDVVILEADRTRDFGKVLIGNHEIDENRLKGHVPRVIRAVNSFDEKKIEENRFREHKAFHFCQRYIRRQSLPMHLVAVEYTFDRKKLKFYFTSNKKVDFRTLVKELVEEFKTGVELRQIGVRDASKILGAVGICGRVVCCHSHLNDFKTVNLKAARVQNILSSPEKISGVCGRLRCCLLYEQENYAKASRRNRKADG